MLVTILIILLILAIVSSPRFGVHSFGWGPSGLFGLIVLILLILLLLGRI